MTVAAISIILRLITLILSWSVTCYALYRLVITCTLSSYQSFHPSPLLSLPFILSFAILPYLLFSIVPQPCYIIVAAGIMYACKAVYWLVFATPKQREAEMWEGDDQHRKQKSFFSFLSSLFTMRPNWQLTPAEFAALPSPTYRASLQPIRILVCAALVMFSSQFSYEEITSSYLFTCLCSYLFGLTGYVVLELICENVCLFYYYRWNIYLRPYFPMKPTVSCAAAFSTSLHMFWSVRWHQNIPLSSADVPIIITSDPYVEYNSWHGMAWDAANVVEKNILMYHLLKHTLKCISYWPLQSWLRSIHAPLVILHSIPILSVFVLSATMHQILAIIGLHDYTAEQLIFFMLQGFIVAIQSLLSRVFPKQTRALPSWLCIAFTHVWLFLTSPYFGRPFFRAGWHLIPE